MAEQILTPGGRGRWRQRTSSNGFGLSFGISVLYMSLLVLLPLLALLFYSAKLSFSEYQAILADPRVLSAFRVSFGNAFGAALINALFGMIIAWCLTRYSFPGQKLIDALIDLPFAIPTAVAGIALGMLFSVNGLIVGPLLHRFNIDIALSQASIVIALIFIGLPFVVRTVQPVIAELDREVEEAAQSLGANYTQLFIRIILPALIPALLTGAALALARGVGEYATVIFISSSQRFVTEIVPVLIVEKLTSFDYLGASVLGSAMLILSLLMLLVINLLQSWMKKHGGKR